MRVRLTFDCLYQRRTCAYKTIELRDLMDDAPAMPAAGAKPIQGYEKMGARDPKKKLMFSGKQYA